jgi:hypothetical protein
VPDFVTPESGPGIAQRVEQLTLLAPLQPVEHLHRSNDPETSREAAAQISRRATHLRAMLAAFAANDHTDVEAARVAGLERVEATRRASELRNTHLIEPIRDQDGVLVTRLLPTNRRGMVCRITEAGRAALAGKEAA